MRWLWLAVLGSTATAQEFSVRRYCAGTYADDASSLSPQVAEFERRPQAQASSYCLRTLATYECLSYAPDGSVRKTRKRHVRHGTAFGYRHQSGDTLLLTNEHVASSPQVTDDDRRVADIPDGCKKVSETSKLVDGEADAFERDDIPVSVVVEDERLDVAIVRAKRTLPVLPYRVGNSSTLKERNAVDVRGFPLGAFRATNVGKVVNAWTHDDEKDWDHDDFMIDALLSQGHSGSPVLAISCLTGEYELVGIYHAGYTRGSALNAVVGIDQVKDMMTTLKRSSRSKPAEATASIGGVPDREKFIQELGRQSEPFFPFGAQTALVRSRGDGVLVFALFGKEFPLQANPLLVVEDLPGDSGSFGEIGKAWFGGNRGLKPLSHGDMGADLKAQMAKLLDALRKDAQATFLLRAAVGTADNSRDRYEAAAKLERAFRKSQASRGELNQLAVDLAERWGPQPGEGVGKLSDAYARAFSNPAFPMPAETSSSSTAR